jgi:microcystin-dependent protein
MATTPNRAIRFPAGSDVPDVPLDISHTATDLDAVANCYFGTFAARGATVSGASHAKGSAGSFYVATDTGQIFVSTGTAWIDLGAGPPIPIGSSLEYGGAGDPTDNRFLLEDGRSLNSTTDTTLASLFAVIGTTYGGTGASAFNLPDNRGSVTVSPDNMGTVAGAAGRLPNNPNGRGNRGGEERHTLSAAELPGPPNIGTATLPLVYLTAGAPLGTGGPLAIPGSGNGNANFAASTPAGSGTPHNNLQPYVVKNKIMRVR